MSYHELGPSTVSYTMAKTIYAYISRLLDLGAIEGELGDMHVSEELEPLVKGIHHLLAGGTVEVTIKKKGSADVVHELEDMVSAGASEANEINKAAGYYVSLAP